MFRTETPRYPSSFPFRFAGKKSPSSSKTIALRSRSLDENLLDRLKTLTSTSDPSSITLSWLSQAVDLLSSTHADAESLVSDLTVSASEKSLASYLDDSVKILDVCNSISSEIERLRQGRLLINFALHLLDSSGGSSPTPEKLRRARESLADWGKSSPGNKRLSLEKSADLIRDLTRMTGKPPRGKISSVETVLQHTIYAVGAVTAFVAGVVVAVLSGSPDLIAVPVSGEFLWADTFNNLQSAVLEAIRKRFSGEKRRFAGETDAVEACVRALADVIDGVAGEEGATEKFGNAVKDLERVTEEFSDGLERLLNGVNGFFRAVLCTRNTLLKSFRVSP